jgi:SAM-dependent methyltransferase
MPADYDALAWFYDRYWRTRYHEAATIALTRLLYDYIPAGSRVLDLCCGTGHLLGELVNRGYRVTGLDRSREMLRTARQSHVDVPLICADARNYALSGFDAAISTFDSLNHLLTIDALTDAFRCTHHALRPGGLFVFDINTEEAYAREWGKSAAIVDEDAAVFIRGDYDSHTRIGRTLITAFRSNGNGDSHSTCRWHRADIELHQRCYACEEVLTALHAAGFRDSDMTSIAASDAGMTGDIAVGRRFFRAAS